MEKYTGQHILEDAKISGFIGIGVSLVLTTVGNGISTNPWYWLSAIVFGYMVGYLISVGIDFIWKQFLSFFPHYQKPLFLLLVIIYIVGVVIFYSFTSLFNMVFIIIPPKAVFYISLSVGIICVMISLFFIYAYEKEEMLRLEKENRKLAIVDERNRIARELHDSVSQNLFGISLNLNTLDVILEKDPVKTREITELLRGMVEEVQAEMRLMIYELKPVALIEKGFFEAIESLVSLFKVRYNLNISCNINGEEELDTQTQLSLYRVLQESLNNIVKHAKASKVRVVLTTKNKSGELVIQDNGQGFEYKDTMNDQKMGICGMKERVEQINGSFYLQSDIGKGTTVKVTF